jgi:hypothetical protein
VVAAAAVDAGNHVGVPVHDRGTVVVVQGPRFSTRAESRWYRAQGWDVVGMTQYPEAYLARELGMHYTGIALVTDYDTGVEDDPGVEAVTMDQVLAVMDANVDGVARSSTSCCPSCRIPRSATARRHSARCRTHGAAARRGRRSLARRSGRATTDGPGIRTGDLVPKRDAG